MLINNVIIIGFEIYRDDKYGGNVVFSTYPQLEEAFAKEEVYPLDLKNAIAVELNKVQYSLSNMSSFMIHFTLSLSLSLSLPPSLPSPSLIFSLLSLTRSVSPLCFSPVPLSIYPLPYLSSLLSLSPVPSLPTALSLPCPRPLSLSLFFSFLIQFVRNTSQILKCRNSVVMLTPTMKV